MTSTAAVPPDGGWGWAVVAGGFLSNCLSMGLYRSGGIIYVSAVHTFSAPRSVAAWIPMVTLTVVFLTAPIATALAKRFSYRRVIFLGGLLASAGMIICSLANSVELLFLGWSIIFGMGSSMGFFPCLALIGLYFKKRRPMATGIVLMGGSLGSFFSPLLNYLVDEYGLCGMTLILSAIVLHYCACALVMIPVKNVSRHGEIDLKINNNQSSINGNNAGAKPLLASVSVDCENGQKFAPKDKDLEKMSNSENEHDMETKSENFSVDRNSEKLQQNENFLARSGNKIENRRKPKRTIFKKIISLGKSDNKEQGNGSDVQDVCPRTRKAVKIVPKSETNQNEGVLEVKSDSKQSSSDNNCFGSFVNAIDLTVVLNRTYMLNCIANAIQTAIFMGVMTVLPDFGEDDIKVSRTDASYFVTAAALCDLLFRFLFGWCLTRVKVRKSILSPACLLLNTCVIILLSQTGSYVAVLVTSGMAGALFAGGMILYFEVLASCQPPAKYPMAFGLSEMMKAPIILTAASTVGTLKDATGSYSATFFIFAAFLFLAAIFWLAELAIETQKARTANLKNKQVW